jgi:hypothetical protein
MILLTCSRAAQIEGRSTMACSQQVARLAWEPDGAGGERDAHGPRPHGPPVCNASMHLHAQYEAIDNKPQFFATVGASLVGIWFSGIILGAVDRVPMVR